MIASNKILRRKIITMSFPLIAYSISSLFDMQILGNILSPIIAFITGEILFYVSVKSKRVIRVNTTLLMLSFGCFSWGIADVIWTVISFMGGIPDKNPVIYFFYTLTNCFFLVSLIIFAIYEFSKWDLIQYGMDLLINGFMLIVLFWIIFLHKDISIFKELINSDYTSIMSIPIDILICIGIFSWFLSVRTGKIPSFIRINAFGMLLFSFVDLFYYYVEFFRLYIPNSGIDVLYTLSMCIVALGALWMIRKGNSTYDFSQLINRGNRVRWIYLLIYPIVAVLFTKTGIINVQLSKGDIISLTAPVFLYWGFCKYIQLSLEKEALLKHQNILLEQRVAEQVNELTFLANRDTLTSLFNRRYFMLSLNDAIKSICQDEMLAIFMIDLDRFKTINDTYGHDVGDKVLIDLSDRLLEWNKCKATIARLGGDEFAIMFMGKYTRKDIENYCIQIIDLCSKPVNNGNSLLYPTMSIGVAIMSEDASDGTTLMKNADIAMYSAKSQGYNKYQFYNRVIDRNFKKQSGIEVQLRQADVEKDFKLYYQPQFSLPDIKLIGAEALIRWDNKEYGYIPPNVFIPVAEEIDHIFKIGKWVMRETIRQSITWNNRYSIPLKIGFNISPKQFYDNEFIQMLKTLVPTGNLDPAWIDAEITEGVMMEEGNHIYDIFTFLRNTGVSVSIDDFGSGYSSLNYLNKYPFDRIKLDKKLIDNVAHQNVSGTNIVRAAIQMAHASGIKTIAEGVESREQLALLIEMGCDQVQGYLVGKPVPAEAFEQWYINEAL